MAKYMDAAGIRALAESAKSYFAASGDVAALTEAVSTLAESAETLADMAEQTRTDLLLLTGYDREALALARTYASPEQNFNFNIADSSITRLPPLDLTKAVSFSAAYCTSLRQVAELYLPNVTSCNAMFAGCSSLTSIPPIYAPKCSDMYAAFAECSSLVECPEMHLSANLSDVRQMFSQCSSLMTVPHIDATNATSIDRMFYLCNSLQRVERLRLGSKLTSMSQAFYGQAGGLNTVTTYILISGIGSSDSITTWDFSQLAAWDHDSLAESLRHASVRSNKTPQVIKLYTTQKNSLTEEEIAAVTAKGYTIA